MTNELFLSLLTDFSRATGLPLPEPDEEGFVTLGSESVVVHLRPAEDGENIEFYARVGELPHDPKPAVLEQLMAANVGWRGTRGATLGFDPATRMVLLCQRRPLQGMHLQDLQRALEDFLSVVEHWSYEVLEADARGGSHE